jgi:hypothetical protein
LKYPHSRNPALVKELMTKEAMMLELLLSGFFAIACFKARAADAHALKFKDLFYLSDRLDRLRRTRWQWCAMVMVIVFSRMQMQAPIVAELTGLAQFVIFLALPTARSTSFTATLTRA